MDNLYMKVCLHFCVFLTFFDGALSTTNFSMVADHIGETVSIKLNLTELGWHTDDMVYSVLAWTNVRHPIAKLPNGSTHSGCYKDLSFLGSVRCTNFNVTVIESNVNVVCIKMRVVTRAMAATYIFYAAYSDHSAVKHNTSLVQISVHLKAKPTDIPSHRNLPEDGNKTPSKPTDFPSHRNPPEDGNKTLDHLPTTARPAVTSSGVSLTLSTLLVVLLFSLPFLLWASS